MLSQRLEQQALFDLVLTNYFVNIKPIQLSSFVFIKDFRIQKSYGFGPSTARYQFVM